MSNLRIAFAVARLVFHLITMAYGIQMADIHPINPPKREYSAASLYQEVGQS